MRDAARRFRQRPPEVEAIQFTGTPESCSAVTDFLGGPMADTHSWNHDTTTGGSVATDLVGEMMIPMMKRRWVGFTPGCWIASLSHGAFRVYRDEDFQRIYEEVEVDGE